MKLSNGKIERLYTVLMGVNLNGMPAEDKYPLVKNLMVLREFVKQFDSFKSEYAQKVKPEGWEEVYKQWQQLREEGNDTTLAEDTVKMITKTVADYNMSIAKGLNTEAAVQHDVDIKTISEKAYEAILKNTDMDCATAMLVADVLTINN